MTRNGTTNGYGSDSDHSLRLSVLDQSPIPEGAGGGEALRNSIDLAKLADGLGYHRYWLAEHHGSPSLACASPEVMIGLVAGATERMRVGSGGVMLPHYSPLKVAETFSMLAGLYPGRIDLGLGRAAGTDRATAFALQRDRRRQAPDNFPEQLDELLAYFADHGAGQGPGHGPGARTRGQRLAPLTFLPGAPHRPDPWLLGSSPQSAIWAAERGLPYVFADFINPAGAQIAALYRDTFKPSETLPEPRLAVAGWAISAETDDEAWRLSSSFGMLMALLHRGQLIPVPPPEKALRFLESDRDANDALRMHRRVIAGTPEKVRSGIEALAREYGAEEVLVVNILYDHAARRRSYELIAEAFALPRAANTAPVEAPAPVG